jgi:hypothetical protein
MSKPVIADKKPGVIEVRVKTSYWCSSTQEISQDASLKSEF